MYFYVGYDFIVMRFNHTNLCVHDDENTLTWLPLFRSSNILSDVFFRALSFPLSNKLDTARCQAFIACFSSKMFIAKFITVIITFLSALAANCAAHAVTL